MADSFEREVLDRLRTIEVKIDDYKELKKDTAEALALSRENSKEIAEIEEKIKWLSRTITGAFITGAIGIVFILIKMSVGLK